MANLIPPSAKKSVVIEYWLRVLNVWSLIATIVAVLFAITFLPLYVLVDSKIDVYRESAEIASQKIASFEAVSKSLKRATQQAQLVLASTKQNSLFATIEMFATLERENNGIQLKQINVTQLPGGGFAPVSLSGNARDRQALSDFRDQLLKRDEIEAVDFPLSNLAKDKDITFTITVTMANPDSL